MKITNEKFLDHLVGALRPVDAILVERNETADFKARVIDIVKDKVEITEPLPPPDPRFKIYIALLRQHYNALFVDNDPDNPPKPGLQSWQAQIAGHPFDYLRTTLEGASYEAAIFKIWLTVSEAVQMVNWLNDNPTVGDKIKDSIRMQTEEQSGFEAFRDFINSDENWTAEEAP